VKARVGLRGLAVAVLGLGLAACGEGGGARGRIAFSQVEVQAYLEKEVTRTMPGLAVGAATCPAELPRRVGATAVCTVGVEGVPLEYEVQLLVGDRFEARPSRPVLVVSQVVAAVQAKLGAQTTAVRCGDARVAQPSSSQPLLCQLTSSDTVRTAAVRVGADGTISVTDN